MVLQNYQNFIEMTSNMIYIVELGVGLKYPRKIHLNTQCPVEMELMHLKFCTYCPREYVPTFLLLLCVILLNILLTIKIVFLLQITTSLSWQRKNLGGNRANQNPPYSLQK